MSDFERGGSARSIPQAADMSVDAGLRGFMLGVYNKMALGLLLSAALAYATSSVPAIASLLYVTTETGRLAGFTLLGNIVRFAPLVMVLFAMFGMRNMTARSSGIFYWSLVTAIGAGSGIWLLIYTGASVFMTFLITATSFGALSLVGYTTKKDLTGFGSFLIMGVWGLVIASLVSMFFNLPGLYWVINTLGVLIFAGLTAYDTQRLKMTYYALKGQDESMAVATNMGALNLYLDFINLFQFLLAFVGVRRD
ncbi:MAG: Bax inhibitor-1/YccA family protein [Caulobacter sp.]|nr:Bax inhibitor-1/YccA family protein [Caulobacter sp.]